MLRNYLADASCDSSVVYIRVPDYASTIGNGSNTCQIHGRFILLDRVYEFMEYCIEQNKLNIEICCNDNDFTQIEMCSFQLRLGRYLLPSTVIGVIFWNLISNYIYDQVEHYLHQTNKEEIIDSKEFQSPPEVSFSIILPDTNGHNKEIKYDGPLEGIEKVGEIIKSMNDETTQRDTTVVE